MSYCRIGPHSDVYVYPSGTGSAWVGVCFGCALTDREETFDSRAELYVHLLSHRETGHKVPARVFERLSQEIRTKEASNDDSGLQHGLS